MTPQCTQKLVMEFHKVLSLDRYFLPIYAPLRQLRQRAPQTLPLLRRWHPVVHMYEDTEKTVHAFDTSRLDYWNS